MTGFVLRPVVLAEIPMLDAMIAASARALGEGYYTPAETEAAITHMFGVDSDLVIDGSYLVASEAGAVIGCGGWSRRATLFGGDRYGDRSSRLLDPATDAAKIRAFFVAPGHARRGVAAALLAACEAAAATAGFTATELMATLPGVPFYAANGYSAEGTSIVDLGGVAVKFVPMRKSLA